MRSSPLLLLLLLSACSAPKTISPVEPTRTVNVRITSELSPRRTRAITDEAKEYFARTGISISERDDCGDGSSGSCIHVGIKRKALWRYLLGYQGWYNATENTVIVYAGISDSYAGKVLAHELGHALGCPHEFRGLMHDPVVTSMIMWPFDGINFATGFSESCAEIIRGGK